MNLGSAAVLSRSGNGTWLNMLIRFAANRGILFTLLSGEGGHDLGACRDHPNTRVALVPGQRGVQASREAEVSLRSEVCS